jgi:hypothetical protein
MEPANKLPEAKHPIEEMGVMEDEMIKASKELFLPGVFATLELKLAFSASGGPAEVEITGSVPFDKLSEKGIKRAKKQGYSSDNPVGLAYFWTSQHKMLDIISKNGGRCDICGHILFEEDGMLVSFNYGTDSSNSQFTNINKIARYDDLAGIDPHIQHNTKYSFLICNNDSCSKGIDEKIYNGIKDGSLLAQIPSSGGCFIATATFGSTLAPEVIILYEFRDLILNKSKAGRHFINLYYRISPALSRIIKRNSLLKGISRQVLKPVILFAKFQLKVRDAKK